MNQTLLALLATVLTIESTSDQEQSKEKAAGQAPAVKADPAVLAKLIEQVGSDDFRIRENATRSDKQVARNSAAGVSPWFGKGLVSSGRYWIRTSDFHRVRVAEQPENHTPQALTVSIVCTDRMIFKGSVHFSVHRPSLFILDWPCTIPEP